MSSPLTLADESRQTLVASLPRKERSRLGQFMTPASIARFMASFFLPESSNDVHLLDAGAGVGSLSCAFLERWNSQSGSSQGLKITAYEVDPRLQEALHDNLHSGGTSAEISVLHEDYILHASSFAGAFSEYTHAILNPPYKKIASKSAYRSALRGVGIDVPNLYAGFVGLAFSQLIERGQLVAIVPRSFCNGPYYRAFRKFLLDHGRIVRVHIFASRTRTFRDDDVLQETLILHVQRGVAQGDILLSSSTDPSMHDYSEIMVPADAVVNEDDEERVFRFPTQLDEDDLLATLKNAHTLADLGLTVSTGPVVDFRVRELLRDQPESGTVPLIYPAHCRGGSVQWPIFDQPKPNAILHTENSRKLLYPAGNYCVIRRLSSKEEKRRVVATSVNTLRFSQSPWVGFENHLNVIHCKKMPLSDVLAKGLALYLNSTPVDQFFRSFSGHTQVNASDLRMLPFPPRDTLERLGGSIVDPKPLAQEFIDALVWEIALHE